MADQELKATLTADSERLESAIGRIVGGFRQIGSSATEAGSAGGSSMERVTVGAERAKGEISGLAVQMESAARAAGGLGTTLELVGLESSGAAQHVRLMSEAVKELTAAALPMLALVVALEAAGKAFEAIKEGVDEGGKLNASLGQIGTSVQNMGGDFKESQHDVREWADQVAGQTGQSALTLTQSVQKLTAAHIDYRTAMAISTAAEREAIASGRDYGEVETALQQAVMGRTRGLVQMGIITKEEAKNGIELSTVINRITESTKGSVEQYQNSLPGAFAITSEKVKQLLVDLGQSSGLSGLLIHIQQAIANVLPIIKEFAEAGFEKVREAGAALSPLLALIAPLFHNINAPVMSLFDSLGHLWTSLMTVVGGILNSLKPALTWFAEYVGHELMAAIGLLKTGLDVISTVLDFFISAATGKWSQLQDDLWTVADDGLSALNSLFGDHLAEILSGIDAFCHYAQDRLGNAFKYMGYAYALQADGEQGGDGSTVQKPDYTPDKGLGDYYKASLKETKAQFASIHSHVKTKRPKGPKKTDTRGLPKGELKDREIGGGTPKATKSSADTTQVVDLYKHWQEATDAVAEAQKRLEVQLGVNSGTESKLKSNIALATTEAEKRAAQAAYDAQVQYDLYQKLNLLDAARAKERADITALTDARSTLIKQYNSEADQLNQLKLAGQDHSKTYTDLLNKYNETGEALKKLDKAITENQNNLAKNTQAARQAAAAIDDYAEAVKKTNAAMSITAEKFYNEHKVKMEEDLAISNMTNAQKYAYFKKLYDDQEALAQKYKAANDGRYVDEEKLAEQTYAKMESSYVALLKDQETARKKWLDTATKDVETFLNDVIVKHQSFRDILKGIYDQLLQAFIAMVAKMIVESALFKSIFGNLAPSGTFGGGSSGGGGGGILGTVLSLFGGGGGGGGYSTGPGSLLSTVPGFSSINGNGVPVNVSSVGGTPIPNSGALPSNIAQVGGNALMGAGIGAMIAGIDGGNQMYGTIGGALGGAFGGPLGAAVGGFIGSLIGPHWGPPSNYPDRSDPSYTPWLNAFNSGPGGVGDQTEKLIASLNPSNLSGQELADYNRLKALENGSGQLGITNEHNGIFSFIGGTTDSVTDFRALVDRFNQEAASGASGPATVWSLTHMAPNFDTARAANWGTYDPTTGATSQVASGTASTPQIVVNVGGLVGVTKEEIAQVIADTLQKNNYYNYGNMRQAR